MLVRKLYPTPAFIGTLLACGLLTTFALYPLWTNEGLPQGSDIAIHYWRTAELEHGWSKGNFLPRWAENFYYGYGYPFFQYYAAGSYSLAALLGKLPYIDDVWRIKLVWILATLMECWGTYLLAARRWGSRAGLLCGASFIFAPAIVFGEPIARGAIPASVGFGFWLMSFALLDRVAAERNHALWAAVSLAGLAWSHNVTAIMGLTVIAAWLAWQATFNRKAFPFLRDAFFILGVGVGLTAFFWIPLGLERDQVILDRLYMVENLDFRTYFQPFRDLFWIAPRYDANLIGQHGLYQLGIASWVLVLVGAAATLYHVQKFRWAVPHLAEMIFWLLVTLTSIYLITPSSRWVWDALPLQFFQFPTRFLDSAALGLAMLAGAAAAWLDQCRPVVRYVLWAAALLGLIWQGLQAVPWGWTEEFPSKATVADYLRYELTTNEAGTTGTNEFLPKTVHVPPQSTDFLIESIAAGDIPLRLNPEAYPPETHIKPLSSSPSEYVFEVELPSELTLEVFMFYFAGWKAYVDGKNVPLGITDPYGFIVVDVPAGKHRVELHHTYTTSQKIGIAVSLFAALLLSGYLLMPKATPSSVVCVGPPALSKTDLLALGGVLLVAWLGSLFFMQEGRAWTASPAGQAHTAHNQAAIVFGDNIHFLGYDFSRPLDDQWRVALYWYFDLPVPPDINAFVHVLNADGEVIAQRDKLSFTETTTFPYWRRDLHLRDVYIVNFSEPPPPGEYRIRVGLWQEVGNGELRRLAAEDETGAPLGEFIFLPETIAVK